MRLLFVLAGDPSPTAPERVDGGRLAEGLARRGHSVHALAVRRAPDQPRAEVRRGVLVHRVPARPGPSGRPSLLRALDGLLERADVLVVPTSLREALPATALARRRGVRAFLIHDADPPSSVGAGPVGRRLGMLHLAATVLAGRLADGVLARSTDEAAASAVLRPLWDQLRLAEDPTLGAAAADPAAPGDGAATAFETVFQRALDGTL